jgi:hypothetical protein
MDTAMHADAMPDADTASLLSPIEVAEKIGLMIQHSDQIESGTRLVASDWKVPYESSALSTQR